jgi:hypothetical protein
LGAHRNRAHGVAGSSSRGTAAVPGSAPSGARSRKRSTAPSAGSTIDRDALLQALFPNGIPAKERVIREVNVWLDQAERLSRQ